MDFVAVFAIFGILYCITLTLLAIGILKMPSTKTSIDRYPVISILVACKNEEKDLPCCINSLKQLTYPQDKLEILLIDDESSDGTSAIIASAANKSNIHSLSTAGRHPTHLRAKARAIALAAKQAKGEWLFITDADAVLHPDWIQHMLSGTNDKIGLIGGMMTIALKGIVSVIEKMSISFIHPFAAGMAGWGVPSVCSGPNMAIRKSVYDNYGGLEKVDFKVAEDLALVKIALESKSKIKFHCSRETTVTLSPVPTLTHLISQQRRWFMSGFELGWEYWTGFIFVYAYHFVFSIILLFGWIFSIEGNLYALFFKLLGDFILVGAARLKLKITGILRYFPVMIAYSTLTFIWLPLSVLFFKRIKWMGEGYEIKFE